MEKISRTKIVDLLKRHDFGAMVNVKGWVRTRRGSKQVNFIALNDGSTINNVQIVVDLANFDEEMLKQITTGACISVNGELTESIGSGQAAEVQARGIEVLVLVIILIRYRRKVIRWSFFVRLLICVLVPIHLELYSASATTWLSLSISSSMNVVSSIFIHLLSQHPIVKVRDRCSRLLPRIFMI